MAWALFPLTLYFVFHIDSQPTWQGQEKKKEKTVLIMQLLHSITKYKIQFITLGIETVTMTYITDFFCLDSESWCQIYEYPSLCVFSLSQMTCLYCVSFWAVMC